MKPFARWTVIDRETVVADPRLHIRRDLCVTAHGDVIGPIHVTDCPSRVTVVALAPGGSKVLLERAYRHGAGTTMMALPGGPIDHRPRTPHLDAAAVAAKQARSKRERGSGFTAQWAERPEWGNPAAELAAAQLAAQCALLEAAGYAADQWACLLKTYPNPSNQANTAFGFLATNLDRVADGHPEFDYAAYDILFVSQQLQRGAWAMDAVDVAALWSAVAHIAADNTGVFGPLSTRLRRFFVGQDDGSCLEPSLPVAFPTTVGG